MRKRIARTTMATYIYDDEPNAICPRCTSVVQHHHIQVIRGLRACLACHRMRKPDYLQEIERKNGKTTIV